MAGANILISRSHDVKLADFGLARSLVDVRAGRSGVQQSDGGYTNRVVTLWYRAPVYVLIIMFIN